MKWFHDTLRCIQSDVNFLRETKHRILFSFNLFLFFFFFFLISLPTIIFIATELEHVKPVDAQHNYGKSDNIVKLHRLTVFQPIRICLEFFLFFLFIQRSLYSMKLETMLHQTTCLVLIVGWKEKIPFEIRIHFNYRMKI